MLRLAMQPVLEFGAHCAAVIMAAWRAPLVVVPIRAACIAIIVDVLRGWCCGALAGEFVIDANGILPAMSSKQTVRFVAPA